MTRFGKLNHRMRIFAISMLSVLMVISFTSVSYAEWNFGIGTGFFALNLDGDVGLNTRLGPIKAEVDLDTSDIMDLMETAFGLGGYATDGTWMIRSSLLYMDLKGDGKGDLPGGISTAKLDLQFEALGGEILVGYPVYKDPSLIVLLDGGARYTNHEISSDMRISSAVNDRIKRDIDESWTDFLIGTTITVPLAEKWVWNTSANAGFGGSEGTYTGYTGLTWRFYKGWSTTLYGKYTAVDYENGDKGDSDWYLYDVDEFGAGINVLYNF